MNTLDLLSTPVRDVMTTNLITVNKDGLVVEIQRIFERQNIHHIPVVNDEGDFIGIVSKSDLMLLLDWGTKMNLPISAKKNAFLLRSNLAKDVMEKNVLTLHPDDNIQKCVQIFRENYFRALPVLDDNGKLVGLITTYDLMILAYTKP